jgi:hypothetical protein
MASQKGQSFGRSEAAKRYFRPPKPLKLLIYFSFLPESVFPWKTVVVNAVWRSLVSRAEFPENRKSTGKMRMYK